MMLFEFKIKKTAGNSNLNTCLASLQSQDTFRGLKQHCDDCTWQQLPILYLQDPVFITLTPKIHIWMEPKKHHPNNFISPH